MDLTPLARIGLAALLAVPIGLERELSGKPAGVRTHLAVAVACATLSYVSVVLAEGDQSADPTRIASQVIVGIGFIGAGVILALRGEVHGLTTAAAVFATAAVGITAGVGEVLAAVGLAVAVFASLRPLDWVRTHTIGSRIPQGMTLHVLASSTIGAEGVHDVLRQSRIDVRYVSHSPGPDGIVLRVTVRATPTQSERLAEDLAACDGVLGKPLIAGGHQVSD